MLPSDDLPLHVGDRLRIVCPEIPEICVDRSIGPDGSIDVPGLGAVPAAVRRPTEVARLVRALLPIEGPPFPVEVRWLGSALGEVAVSGAVERPLRLYAPHGIERDRLMAAARPLRDADMTLVTAARRLAPGTAVEVPSLTAERKISVVGGVATPSVFPPRDGFLLASALEAAGGLSGHGDPAAIVVVRANEPIPVTLPADAGFVLRPGDLVRVGLIADRHYVTVKGLVVRPGTVDYARGMTATRALAAAGGVRPELQGGVLVWQTGPKTFRLSLAFLMERRIPDPVLGSEDTLIVEAGRP